MADNDPKPSKGPLVLGLLIITVGVGWLLTAKGVAPGIDWVWTLGLGVVGIAAFVVSGGVDKVSLVVGPFFLIASGLSVMRQTGQLERDIEVPVLVILVGVLVVLAQMSFIPVPRWAVTRSMERDRT
jgi:hypothetical protein